MRNYCHTDKINSSPFTRAVYTRRDPQRLRAYVEIIGRELVIFPIADSDTDEKAILDALRFVIADGVGR